MRSFCGICTKEYKSYVEMYISRYFFEKNTDNNEKEREYRKNCSLTITENLENRNDSLTEMRQKMIQRDKVKALVCLGGKVKTEKVEEGIREEIQLAIEYGIPVFIVGTVGGCAALVAKEYEASGWKELNDATIALNRKFLEDTDYFNMAQEMICYLNSRGGE